MDINMLLEISLIILSIVLSSFITWFFTKKANEREDKKELRSYYKELLIVTQDLMLSFNNYRSIINSEISKLNTREFSKRNITSAYNDFMAKYKRLTEEKFNLDLLGDEIVTQKVKEFELQLMVFFGMTNNLSSKSNELEPDKIRVGLVKISDNVNNSLEEVCKTLLDFRKK